MIALLRNRLPEVIRAVSPLVAVVCLLQVLLVRAPATVFLQFLGGSALAILGMALLFGGIDAGILPMGHFIGAELPRKRSLALILAVAFAMGFATTLAEPDVLVLAGQVESVSSGTLAGRTLMVWIAVGVGVFTALGLWRIVRGFSLSVLLASAYAGMLALSLVRPAVSSRWPTTPAA